MQATRVPKRRGEAGQILLGIVILFTVITTATVLGVTTPIMRQIQMANDTYTTAQSYLAGESLAEDIAYRLKNAKSTSVSESLTVGSSTAVATVSSNLGVQTIVSTGNDNALERTVTIVMSQGTGIAFNYGTQSGNGGFVIKNNAGVIGNVYSNGSITGASGAYVTGTTIAANSISTTVDQKNDSPTIPSNDIVFANANTTQDIAQSFQLSSAQAANSVSFYIKKIGSPGDATVRIITDSGGTPGGSQLTSATLSAALVTTSYGWVSVVFPAGIPLASGTTYWLVIDASSNSSNYYTIGGNSNYASGEAQIGKYGSSWANTSPAGLDVYFRFYVGGLTATISNVTVGSAGIGDTWAHTVNNSTIAGNNYCQIGVSNNKPCDTSKGDPSPQPYPVSDGNIAGWKADAAAGTVISGDKTISSATSLGPAEITGNLYIYNTLTLTGIVYVEGAISTDNNQQIKLDPSFGSSGTILMADGNINLSNGANFSGSGTSGSYVLLLTNSTCTAASCGTGNSAVNIANNVGAVIINAQKGEVYVKNGAAANEITADYVDLEPNATVTYQSGLANSSFTSGPSGGYQINSWKETQ